MVNDIFLYNSSTNQIELNTPEILLVDEFKQLLNEKRNKCKEDPKGKFGLRAFREFTYIWLALSWKSVYSEYDESERHTEAMKDAHMTQQEFDDPTFRAACRKFRQIQESRLSVRLLSAAQEMTNKFIEYFKTVDPLERDETTNKPVYKAGDIMKEISNLGKMLDELVDLEKRVKKDMAEKSTIRAGAIEGFEPM